MFVYIFAKSRNTTKQLKFWSKHLQNNFEDELHGFKNDT